MVRPCSFLLRHFPFNSLPPPYQYLSRISVRPNDDGLAVAFAVAVVNRQDFTVNGQGLRAGNRPGASPFLYQRGHYFGGKRFAIPVDTSSAAGNFPNIVNQDCRVVASGLRQDVVCLPGSHFSIWKGDFSAKHSPGKT